MTAKNIAIAAAGTITSGGGGGGGGSSNVSQYFATTLYTGYPGSHTVTTDIDLATDGGIVWSRAISGSGYGNQKIFWQPQYGLNPADEMGPNPYGNMGTFTTTGFNLVYDWTNLDSGNKPDAEYVSWSFKRAAKFFDYVTWTGDGTSNRVISHNLGQSPGMVIIATATHDPAYSRWNVRHIGIESSTYNAPNVYSSALNSAYVPFTRNDCFAIESLSLWTDHIKLASYEGSCNETGVDYIAFLFGNDSAEDGCIKCGMYTGNGSTTGPTVTLDWEPQWLLIKGGTGYGYNWWVYDSTRGMSIGDSPALQVNDWSNLEQSLGNITTSSTGFQILTDDTQLNESGTDYVYMAIRKP